MKPGQPGQQNAAASAGHGAGGTIMVAGQKAGTQAGAQPGAANLIGKHPQNAAFMAGNNAHLPGNMANMALQNHYMHAGALNHGAIAADGSQGPAGTILHSSIVSSAVSNVGMLNHQASAGGPQENAQAS